METMIQLTQKSNVIIFAYAPAGLGHLRVTDALYHGLAQSASPLLLGSQDKTIRVIHRITSVNPLGRRLFEWLQYPIFPTALYRFYLQHHTKLLYQQLVTILDQRLVVPKTVVVVATHFGLAHQLAKIRKKIEAEKNIQMYLFVQVTDDSPQPIWYIEGSAIIFVPSNKTKDALQLYGKQVALSKQNIQVIAYPVAPMLTALLSHDEFQNRLAQVDPQKTSHTHVAIPISGAAVGTHYLQELITKLYHYSKRYAFHVLSKQAGYTNEFIQQIQHKPYVSLTVSTHDRGIVDAYDTTYQQNIISLEVTKPSEQAFKAICTPKTRGGSLLLFSEPVGRQEHDNLDFLSRHFLLPTHDEQQQIWQLSEQNASVSKELLEKAQSWRAVLLPKNSETAAVFIEWCLKQHIFLNMMYCAVNAKKSDEHAAELSPSGVSEFWKHVEAHLWKITKK